MASPPSSSSTFGPSPGQVSACFVHHQYSASVSPFHANTGTRRRVRRPVRADRHRRGRLILVEKRLHDAQRRSAPNSTSVWISAAVCTVMRTDPVIRAPARGLEAPNCMRIAINPGISCSANRIWSRPAAAKEGWATLKALPVTLIRFK